MNAAETIQAAIDRLTALEAVSTQDPWVASWEDVSDEMRTAVVFGTYRKPDAHLIVTLHRTIDAQLDVLTAALFTLRATRLGFTAASVHAAHKLAKAILGGTE